MAKVKPRWLSAQLLLVLDKFSFDLHCQPSNVVVTFQLLSKKKVKFGYIFAMLLKYDLDKETKYFHNTTKSEDVSNVQWA